MVNPSKSKERHKLYVIWHRMNFRCYNSSDRKYARYGGRGIKVCDEWNNKNKNSFNNFYQWAISNGYDSNAKRGECSLDRIDNDGNYEPSNCRWANNIQQCRNMASNRIITYKNQEHCLAEWCEILKLPYKTIYSRLYRLNFSVEKAFETPINHKS